VDADHTPAPNSRAYGGVSADERRAQRRAALLEAALDLLAEGGADAVTKRAVCARARLNDRYFYEQFADRDALIRILGEDLTSQGLQVSVAAVLAAEPGTTNQIHAGVAAAFEFLVSDPRRTALLRESHTNDVLYQARAQTQHSIAKAMAELGRDLTVDPEFDPADAKMAGYLLVAGTFELITAWFRSEFQATQEHMVELVTRMLMQSQGISFLDR
jgi:AcrR family transcriptional regulator